MQVRARLLHDHAGGRQAFHGRRRRMAHGRGHRADAKIGRIGDADRQAGVLGRRQEGLLRGLQGNGILIMASHQSIQHQGAVGDIARHGALDAQTIEGKVAGTGRHAPRARAQAHHAAVARRRAQRAAEIGARGKPDLACSQRRRRATRRPAGGKLRIPGGAGIGEELVIGISPGAEFGRVGFGEHNAAGRLHPLDHDVGALRNVSGIDGRGEGGQHAGHILQILDRERQASQQARPIDARGCLAGALGGQRGQRMDRGLGRLDAGQRRLDHLAGRDLGLLQQANSRPRGQAE